MLPIAITEVTPQDIARLQKIGRETFYKSFSEVNSEADMEDYPSEGFSIEKITADVNDQNTLIYFAKLEGLVIGFFIVNIIFSLALYLSKSTYYQFKLNI